MEMGQQQRPGFSLPFDLSPGARLASQLLGPGGRIAGQLKTKSEGDEADGE